MTAGPRTSEFPQTNRESGMANWKQALRPELAYLTSQCARRRARKAQKGVIFRGNKANRWFRMSNLSQKWPKNKANPFGPRQGLWVSASSSVIVGRHQLGPPVFNYSSTPTRFLTRRGPSFEPVSSSIGQLVSSSVKN